MSFLDDILNALKKAPEDVQKRVASGELPIDAASLAQRQADQVNPEQLYHWTGREFSEFNPSTGGKYGPGIYLSPRKWYGEKYVSGGTPQRMDVKSKGQIAEFKDIAAVEPEARRILQEIEPEGYNFGNTYWTLIGDELQKKGFTGLRMDDEVVVFDPRNVKANTSVLDPEYKGANIYGLNSGKGGPDLAGKAIDSAASNAPGFLDSILGMIQSDNQQQVLDTTYYGDDSMGEDKGKDYTKELNKIADMPAEMWDNMKTREKVALVTSAVPVVGTATGVYADVMNMIEDPEERTLVNSMLLASNFIPASKVARMADKLGITESFNRAKSALVGPDGRPIDEYLHMSKPGESKMVLGETGYDPRYIQGKRKSDVPIMADTEIVRESVGNQILNKLRPEDLQGRGFVTSMADRTAAGGKVTEINGVKLNRPVDLHGGQGYALNNPDKAWASATGVVSSMLNKGKVIAEETGMNPILAPFIMAPTGNDFATKTGTVMLSYAEAAMNKTQKKALNRAMKQIDKSWPGVDDPMADQFFENMKPAKRKAAQKMMDKEFREKGGLSLSQARAAVSDASQLNAPDLSLMNLMEYDPSLGRLPSTNPSYDDSLRGRYMGTVQGGFNATDIVPGYKAKRGFDDITKLSGSDFANEAYSFRQTAPVGVFTNQILDEMLKKGAFD